MNLQWVLVTQEAEMAVAVYTMQFSLVRMRSAIEVGKRFQHRICFLVNALAMYASSTKWHWQVALELELLHWAGFGSRSAAFC